MHACVFASFFVPVCVFVFVWVDAWGGVVALFLAICSVCVAISQV